MEVATRMVANLARTQCHHARRQWQHGSIGELEQCDAAGEDQERADLK